MYGVEEGWLFRHIKVVRYGTMDLERGNSP